MVSGSARKREDPGYEVGCFFRGGHYSSRLMFIWRISTCFRGVINPQVEEKSIEFCDVFHMSIKWIVPALLQGVIVL